MLDLSGYEIRGLLGAGGMGEVHRAYDKRLGREVAIKRLPQAFTTDPDRLARFEREARVLASLNHPNIAAIYGIEDTSSDPEHRSSALILELVEGPTLADRIERGPLKIAEATDVAIQIARALEAAHESGIVHRDLKPANIKITPQGTVKVLDFGLATPVRDARAERTGLANVSTVSVQHTRPGAIMGTPSYMSPEQARGLAVDRRTDVWAFGCVLFEMLTGKPSFSGATMTDIVAKVLEREPDWASLPQGLPDAMHRVLRWALVKDVHRRLRHVGDAILELEASASSASRHDVEPSRRRWPMVAALVGAATIGVIIGAVGTRWLASTVNPVRASSRFAIPVAPLEVQAQNVAISPDGRYVAYLAGPPAHQKTYLRRVDDRQSRVISELPMQAPQPFFSPDSQWVAFFDAGKLKKLSIEGGESAVTLAEAPTPRGGTWISDGSIVFAPNSRAGLMWLPASGGPPQALTSLDEKRGESSHRQPEFLPGSQTVLFVAESSGPAARSLQAVSLDTKTIRVVNTGDGLLPRYVSTGHLAQVIAAKLVITPFDMQTLRFTGPPATVLEDVNSFSFSNDGTLVYSDAPVYNTRESSVVWANRDGSVQSLPLPPALYDHPRLSADGQKIVIHRADTRPVDGSGLPASGGLWIYDNARETLSKLTSGSSDDWPVWSADGTKIIYGSNRPRTTWDIFVIPVDGSGPEQPLLLPRPLVQIPRAASPTGDALIYEEIYADRPSTLWRLPLHGPAEPRPLFGAGAGEMMPTFSPDGRWVGYVSFTQSGRSEIYVRASTGEGSIWQISNAGGVEPVWSADGRELFYRADDKMMAVDVVPATPISFGKPHVLFEGSYLFGSTEGQEFDVSRDRRRFLMLKPQRPLEAIPLSVIVNWFDDLRRRVPASP